MWLHIGFGVAGGCITRSVRDDDGWHKVHHATYMIDLQRPRPNLEYGFKASSCSHLLASQLSLEASQIPKTIRIVPYPRCLKSLKRLSRSCDTSTHQKNA